jgi:FMN reductase
MTASATSLLAVVGAVTPPGRLNAAVTRAVEHAARRPTVSASVLNLAEHRISFADGRPLEKFDDDTAAVVGRLIAADAVLLASPVYRGTYTGALKNFLDLAPVDALRNKPVGIVAMGATLHHYLGVDWQLRAVLGWFGAHVTPTSVYLDSSHFRDGQLVDAASTAALTSLVDALLDMPSAAGAALGPPPLAAGRG